MLQFLVAIPCLTARFPSEAICHTSYSIYSRIMYKINIIIQQVIQILLTFDGSTLSNNFRTFRVNSLSSSTELIGKLAYDRLACIHFDDVIASCGARLTSEDSSLGLILHATKILLLLFTWVSSIRRAKLLHTRAAAIFTTREDRDCWFNALWVIQRWQASPQRQRNRCKMSARQLCCHNVPLRCVASILLRYNTTLRFVTLFNTVLCYVMIYQAMIWYVILCQTMSWNSMLCYVMLHYAMIYHATLLLGG